MSVEKSALIVLVIMVVKSVVRERLSQSACAIVVARFFEAKVIMFSSSFFNDHKNPFHFFFFNCQMLCISTSSSCSSFRIQISSASQHFAFYHKFYRDINEYIYFVILTDGGAVDCKEECK